MEFTHVPVMVEEVMNLLKPEPCKRYLDGTLGGGGHTEQILLRSSPDGRVLGLDRDAEALVAARKRLVGYGDRLTVRQADFAEAKGILTEIGWEYVDGVLLDLGVSSYQFESPERGFAFQSDARLDMRMDRRQSLNAFEIINRFPIAEIERILRAYGEEPQARRIALTIGAERTKKPIETTGALAAIVARVRGRRNQRHHPATKTFQALRIAVNRELESLQLFLESGYDLLQSRGRMVIISFHSLEDRLVKNAVRKWSRSCLCPPYAPHCQCGWSQKVRVMTKKPMAASRSEVDGNPRARSAKLRAVERI
jgi:16S rRNA (cytosine1402-N4)-methyltransferase